MFNRIMQVQAEYTPRVQKYKQPHDDAPDTREMRLEGLAAHRHFSGAGVVAASRSECGPTSAGRHG